MKIKSIFECWKPSKIWPFDAKKVNYVKYSFWSCVTSRNSTYVFSTSFPSSFSSPNTSLQSRFACTTHLGRAFREWVDTLPISRLRWTHFSSAFLAYYSRVVVTHHDYIRHFRSNWSRSKISQNHYEFTNFTFSFSLISRSLPLLAWGWTTSPTQTTTGPQSKFYLHGPAELHTNPQKRVTALPHIYHTQAEKE